MEDGKQPVALLPRSAGFPEVHNSTGSASLQKATQSFKDARDVPDDTRRGAPLLSLGAT